MNILSRDKQIEIVAALTEGLGMRATTRLTGVDRKTVARLQMRIGLGCAELLSCQGSKTAWAAALRAALDKVVPPKKQHPSDQVAK